jgi:hypothetical protein
MSNQENVLTNAMPKQAHYESPKNAKDEMAKLTNRVADIETSIRELSGGLSNIFEMLKAQGEARELKDGKKGK